MAKRRKEKPGRRSRARFAWIAGVCLPLVAAVLWVQMNSVRETLTGGFEPSWESDREAFGKYAGSESCRDCHSREHELWRNSHHAAAERLIDVARDRAAFDPPRKLLQHGAETLFFMQEEQLQIVAPTTNGVRATFAPDRILGVEPLYQFLVPFPGGRWQMTEAAFDPVRGEWFNVFGDEERHAGEWGHWTGRGMNWNSMCAGCHNTRVRKNYDLRSDTYATSMAEMGVGCEACHGPMRAHAEWRRAHRKGGPDPTVSARPREGMLSTCGACHARRSELTGDFRPGDSFLDHYSLSIPDDTDLFYPDGQVREEDFEFTSFLSSKMHSAGVRCGDCHEPHSGKTILADNFLCMRCHSGAPPPGITAAPRIDPLEHSRHKQDSPGNDCVECHMPQTTFMQRHARRDHGFTSPDPWLTKQQGIPNACNRCHKDKATDWALEHFDNWYGADKERPARTRAGTIARARAGDSNAIPELMRLADSQPIPLWRAVATTLLGNWNSQSSVVSLLLRRLRDADALVRARAARALAGSASQSAEVRAALDSLLTDASRSVRIESAWALRSTVATNTQAGADLLRWLDQNRDQPGGLLNIALFLNDRGQTVEALGHLEKAVSWDPNSAPIRQVLAISLSQNGKVAEAAEHLARACELAPGDAGYRYHLGLALNELGRLDEAVAALEKSVALEERFASAWYNLGLGYSAQGRLEDAIQALARAETLDGASPRIPYASATVFARLGRRAEARAAAERALTFDPNYREAAELLHQLSGAPAGNQN